MILNITSDQCAEKKTTKRKFLIKLKQQDLTESASPWFLVVVLKIFCFELKHQKLREIIWYLDVINLGMRISE